MNTDQNSPADTIRQISLHQASLLAYILALHPDRSEAQDILQETNVVLWQKIGEFRPGTNFRAWAFRIAYLQTLAHFKRTKRSHWLGFSTELIETLADEAEPLLTDLEQRQRALRHCVEKLPAQDRDIVRAHYESEQPLAELSARLGRSVGALKQVLFRVRRTLRACIEIQLTEGAGDV
ncbi:MAG: sigma-70 family RNA polymerase sigma factor [Planctomycetales bacterium]